MWLKINPIHSQPSFVSKSIRARFNVNQNFNLNESEHQMIRIKKLVQIDLDYVKFHQNENKFMALK